MNYKRLQRNLIHLNSVDSTNNFAAKLIKSQKVENGTTILTKRQTAGRGQRGSVWQSDTNDNLLQSTIVYPDLNVRYSFYLNVISSLAIHKQLIDLSLLDARIKWPNDIIYKDKKIAGILIENQIKGSVIHSSIIGIGLNVNQVSFPNEPVAGSIRNFLPVDLNLEAVAENLFFSLDFYFDLLMLGDFEHLKSLYLDELYKKDDTSLFRDSEGEFTGTISGIDDEGLLVVQKDKGQRKYQMGEIEML